MNTLKPLVKAELRKLYTARSTYGFIGFGIVLVSFLSFYVEGFKSVGPYNDPSILTSISSNAVSFVAILGALVAVLLVTHEYRYNTITYSLTSARSRTDFLVAKIIAVSIFALVLSFVIAALAPVLLF